MSNSAQKYDQKIASKIVTTAEQSDISTDARKHDCQKTAIISHLKATKWFSSLPDIVLNTLAVDAKMRVAAPKEPVFTIGQYEGHEVYLLVKGKAQLTTASPKTGDMHLEEVGTGNCIGLEYVLSGALDLTGSVALTATEQLMFITLDTSQIVELLDASPDFTREILKVIALTLAEQRFDIPEENNDSTMRLIAALSELLEPDPENTSHYIIKKMPRHRELSAMAGVTEEDSAEIIARLISEGIARRQYPSLVIENYNAFTNL